MKKWINDYPYLSVREDSGVKLIKELTGLEAQHLLDPTLIINSEAVSYTHLDVYKRQLYQCFCLCKYRSHSL